MVISSMYLSMEATKLVEFLHYFFLVHIPVAFIEAFSGPDQVVLDVCSNVYC